MYRAKANGRSRSELFDPSMVAEAEAERQRHKKSGPRIHLVRGSADAAAEKRSLLDALKAADWNVEEARKSFIPEMKRRTIYRRMEKLG